MTRREHRAERRDRLGAEICEFLAANPKRGHQDIARGLGLTAPIIKRVLRHLVEAQRIIQMHDPTPAGIKVGKFYYTFKENTMKPITAQQIRAYPGGATPEQAEHVAEAYNAQWAGVTWTIANGRITYTRGAR